MLDMKIAVMGGTGLIGSQVVKILQAAGHDAVPHSQSTGVDLLTGQGLPEALKDAEVVVNLTNSPTFDDASPAFFQTTMDNLLTAAERAGVGHAVILSIVGVDLVPDLAYYRAKVLQEDILKASSVPYSIVRATQFFEFVDAIMSWTADENTVRLPANPVQPMARPTLRRPSRTSAWALPCRASAMSPARTSSRSTNWAGSPSPPTATSAPSPPTPPPVCSLPCPATP
ncbi:hypothetical protein GCM10027614_09610 [Micromonospora vulcania]